MAVSKTLSSVGDRLGFGTSVAAHPRTQWPAWQSPTGAPSGSATSSSTTDASSGAVTFTGLVENTDYVIYASGKPLIGFTTKGAARTSEIDTSSATIGGGPRWDGGKLAMANPNFVTPEDFVPGIGAGTAKATSAVQQAATYAIANDLRLVLAPTNFYDLDDTISLVPASGASFGLDIEATGPSSNCIRWSGADSKAIFQAFGWKRSSIRGVRVRLTASKTGVVVWDLDVDATRTSTGNLDFFDCHVTTAAAQTSCVGWRYGHTGGATVSPQTEMSFIAHYGCGVAWNGSAANAGCYGYVNEHANGLHFTYSASSASQCAVAFSNNSTSGAASATGGDSMFFVGCGGSNNLIEYEFARAGVYSIEGGRWELGTQFLSVPGGGGTTSSYTIKVEGVKGAGYLSNTAKLFDIEAAAALTVDGCRFYPGTGSFDANMIYLKCGSTGVSSVNVHGNTFTAADPYYTIAQGTWRRNLHGNLILNSSGQTLSSFASVIDRVSINAYSRAKAQLGFPAPDAHGLFESTMLPVSQRAYYGRFVPTEDIVAAKMSFAYDIGGGSAADNSLELGIYDSTGAQIATTGAQADKLLTAGGNTVLLSLTGSVTLVAGSVYYAGWQVYGTINAAIRVVVLNSGSVQSNKVFAATVPSIEMCRHDVGSNGLPLSITVGSGQSQVPKMYIRSA
jgi:hypothetical protein